MLVSGTSAPLPSVILPVASSPVTTARSAASLAASASPNGPSAASYATKAFDLCKYDLLREPVEERSVLTAETPSPVPTRVLSSAISASALRILFSRAVTAAWAVMTSALRTTSASCAVFLLVSATPYNAVVFAILKTFDSTSSRVEMGVVWLIIIAVVIALSTLYQ
jgi:hypothetical protein